MLVLKQPFFYKLVFFCLKQQTNTFKKIFSIGILSVSHACFYSCFMFLSSINTNRKSNMHFPQHRRQENSSGGQALAWGRPCPLPFPPSCSFLPSPLLPSSLVPILLRSIGPLKSSEGSGEHCKLPQRGLGRSPSRQTIWCILALKSDIWWQQFNNFFFCKTFLMTVQPSGWGQI